MALSSEAAPVRLVVAAWVPVGVALALRVNERVTVRVGLGLTLAELARPDNEVPVTLGVATTLGLSEKLRESVWAGVVPPLGVSVGLGVGL